MTYLSSRRGPVRSLIEHNQVISGTPLSIPRSIRILMTYAESSLEIFCLRFDHMVAIPMNNTGPMNKKTVVKVKKGMISKS